MIFRPKDRTTWRYRGKLLGAMRDLSLKTDWRPEAVRREQSLSHLSRTEVGQSVLRLLFAGRLTLDAILEAAVQGEEALRALAVDAKTGKLPDLVVAWRETMRPGTNRDQHQRQLRRYLESTHTTKVSQLTAPRIAVWLRGLEGSDTTRWHYGVTLKMFTAWLTENGYLGAKVTFPLPKRSPPRTRYLELSDVQRLMDAAAPEARAAFALMYGAGIELGAVLTLRKRDLEPDGQERTVRARGTKTHTRDRLARVEAWAWPHVSQAARTLLPDALVCPLSAKELRTRHHAALTACQLPHATMHDARHSWAVRMLRMQVPVEAVARQLGHKDSSMVAKVYGRFVPSQDDWARWERGALQGTSDPVAANR